MRAPIGCRFRQSGGAQCPLQRHHAEAGGDHRGDSGTRQGVAQLVAWVVCLPAHTRYAAEQPQVDLLNFDALPPRDERVAELVREDARKQQQRA